MTVENDTGPGGGVNACAGLDEPALPPLCRYCGQACDDTPLGPEHVGTRLYLCADGSEMAEPIDPKVAELLRLAAVHDAEANRPDLAGFAPWEQQAKAEAYTAAAVVVADEAPADVLRWASYVAEAWRQVEAAV